MTRRVRRRPLMRLIAAARRAGKGCSDAQLADILEARRLARASWWHSHFDFPVPPRGDLLRAAIAELRGDRCRALGLETIHVE